MKNYKNFIRLRNLALDLFTIYYVAVFYGTDIGAKTKFSLLLEITKTIFSLSNL